MIGYKGGSFHPAIAGIRSEKRASTWDFSGRGPGIPLPNSFKTKRQALRVLTEDIRGADVSAPTPRGPLRENRAFLRSYI